MTTDRNLTPSLVRTIVPMIVGALAAWLLEKWGVTLPLEPTTETLTVVLSALYYSAIRALESRWPWLGAFLGSLSTPHYGEDAERVNALATDEEVWHGTEDA